MFDWESAEPAEYNRGAGISFVALTTRGYLTATGTAAQHTADPAFLTLAKTTAELAAHISQGAKAGLMIPGFKPYRPYPVQAVWTGDAFTIWLKQPLFITASVVAAAKAQVAGATAVSYAEWAEGVEIQTSTTGPVTPAVLTTLKEAAQAQGYALAAGSAHREVYLDGLPLTADKQVLVRLALAPGAKQPPLAARN